MDSLDRFLEKHADKEESSEPEDDTNHTNFIEDEDEEEEEEQEYNEQDLMDDPDATFGQKLGYDEDEIADSIKLSKKYNDKYYESKPSFNKTKNFKRIKTVNKDSLLHKIQSYTFKRSSINNGSGLPLETKIHNTPLSRKAQYRKMQEKDYEANQFQSRDPRFFSQRGLSSSRYGDSRAESGWKLRKAYQFLDDIIDRDIDMIRSQIKDNKKSIKQAKKTANGYSKDIDIGIRQKGAVIDTLKKELIALTNRKNRIKEKDLEQQSKSAMRKMEIEQVSAGHKRPYHHRLEKTRFGEIKWNKGVNKDKDGDKPRMKSIQNVYLEKKFDRLKQDGKLEKYMKKKNKRINTRLRAAFKKKSGRGWNDSI